MIDSFRKFFGSKLGMGVTLAFLILIAFAFAGGDVANTGTFGGVSGGDRVAVVGNSKIGTGELSRAASNEVDRLRAQEPTLSLRAFVERGGIASVLDRIIDRTAIREFAEKYGLRAGDNLVNSEIMTIPAFRGVDGNFSEDAYRQALGAQGLTDKMVRDDLAIGVLSQQLLVPATFDTRFPNGIAARYAALLRERRTGSVISLPSSAFAPASDPTSAELEKFYRARRGDFIRPERRVVRYATFGTESIESSIAPTDAEIAARYQRDRAKYAASEQRTITQIVAPTEQGARALRDQIEKGTPIATVAARAGFSTAPIGPVTKSQLLAQSSNAVANAAFSTAEGKVTQPTRSGLGWHIIQVDKINAIAAKTLADARGEIVEALRAEKRRRAIADLSAGVEEQIDEGTALTELARSLGVEPQATRPITGDGRVYGSPTEAAPAELRPVLATAFQMDEGEPQLAEIVPGQKFLIYEVTTITESAPAALSEIRPQVTQLWRLEQGSQMAKLAAERVLGRIAKGESVDAAVAKEGVPLPPVQRIDLDREQLVAQTRGQVPAPLALLFSMAQGTSKKLEGPGALGWYVVDLDSVKVTPLAANDPLIADTQRELSRQLGDEYSAQLVAAIRKEVGVEKNAPAIEAVRKLLIGEN